MPTSTSVSRTTASKPTAKRHRELNIGEQLLVDLQMAKHGWMDDLDERLTVELGRNPNVEFSWLTRGDQDLDDYLPDEWELLSKSRSRLGAHWQVVVVNMRTHRRISNTHRCLPLANAIAVLRASLADRRARRSAKRKSCNRPI
jgi:hypothetical protein